MVDNADISSTDIMAVLKGQTNPVELKLRRITRAIHDKLGEWVSLVEIESLTKAERFGSDNTVQRETMLEIGAKGFTRKVGAIVDELEKEHTRVLKNAMHGSFDSFSKTIDSLARTIALRMILAEREHIPGKPEAKEARRKAATAHHGPKKKGGSRVAKKAQERKLARDPWSARPKMSKQKRARMAARWR